MRLPNLESYQNDIAMPQVFYNDCSRMSVDIGLTIVIVWVILIKPLDGYTKAKGEKMKTNLTLANALFHKKQNHINM